MGLVQNLKRTLTNWVDKILVELSCLYIKQVAKQTSKKQNNSLYTESLPNHLTQEDLPTTIATSSAGTSEKTIMMETPEIVSNVRQWAIDKVNSTMVKVWKESMTSLQSWQSLMSGLTQKKI